MSIFSEFSYSLYQFFFVRTENEIEVLKVLGQNVKPNIDNKSPYYYNGESSKVINVLIANS